jgi:hypothetical protein
VTEAGVGAGTIGGAGLGTGTADAGVGEVETGRQQAADAMVDDRVVKNLSKNS